MQETMCMDVLIPCSVKPKLIKVPLLVMLSLAQPGFPECADCYKLLHQFWCAQTVPTCGIFEKVIDEILVSLSGKSNGNHVALCASRASVSFC
jgi:hypothetical protein